MFKLSRPDVASIIVPRASRPNELTELCYWLLRVVTMLRGLPSTRGATASRVALSARISCLLLPRLPWRAFASGTPDSERIISIDTSSLYGRRRSPQQAPAADVGHAPAFAARTKETPLVSFLRSLVLLRGPLTMADFMRHCLSHGEHGYYMRRGREVFGRGGDFTTSPEISQMFGELLSVWVIATWQGLVQRGLLPPDQKFWLVECGPGRGTLAADMLRVLGRLPAAKDLLAGVHLIETSAELRTVQAASLKCDGITREDAVARAATEQGKLDTAVIGAAGPAPGVPVHWHDSLEDIPHGRGPVFIIAQELFDALPVHQLMWTSTGKGGWRERMVDVDDDAAAPTPSAAHQSRTSLVDANGQPVAPTTPPAAKSTPSSSAVRHHFKVVRAPGPTPASIAFSAHEHSLLAAAASHQVQVVKAGGAADTPLDHHSDGDVAEYSPASVKLAHHMACRIGADGGAALLVDYGSSSPYVWSLRGIQKHAFVNPLLEPGEVDLSCDVDFASLAHAAHGSGVAAAHGPLTQGQFLQNMGIGVRLQRLMATTEGEWAVPGFRSVMAPLVWRMMNPRARGEIFV